MTVFGNDSEKDLFSLGYVFEFDHTFVNISDICV